MTDTATTPTVLRARNGSLRHSLPDIGWGFIVAWGLATVFTPATRRIWASFGSPR